MSESSTRETPALLIFRKGNENPNLRERKARRSGIDLSAYGEGLRLLVIKGEKKCHSDTEKHVTR